MTQSDHPIPQTLDIRRRRLIFRAQHRGTFENDLLLGDFVKSEIAAMAVAELDELEIILDTPDPDLADWLTGRRPIPADTSTPLLYRIRAAALNRCA